jgi:hypothetical protein
MMAHGAVRVELGDQLERRVGVVDVVVAELLALQLGRWRRPAAFIAGDVEGRPLVRVLAIAQRLLQRPAKEDRGSLG